MIRTVSLVITPDVIDWLDDTVHAVYETFGPESTGRGETILSDIRNTSTHWKYEESDRGPRVSRYLTYREGAIRVSVSSTDGDDVTLDICYEPAGGGSTH